MSDQQANGRALSLEQLIAFNDELIALVRAGVPLDAGLQRLAEDRPMQLGAISSALATRISRGESLEQAMAAEGNSFPREYQVLVDVGLKSGKMTSALEAVSNFANELVELRRRVAVAMLYPVIVLMLAYGLFVIFLWRMPLAFESLFESMRLPVGPVIAFQLFLRDTFPIWGFLLPALLVLFFVWWWKSTRQQTLNASGLAGPMRWIPGIKSVTHHHRVANFSELMALMIDHNVPMQTALPLAGEAVGTLRMRQETRSLADALTRGIPIESVKGTLRSLPPFLRWVLTHEQPPPMMTKQLRMTSRMYRRKAISKTEWMKFSFPLLLSVVVGGGATLLYGLTLFLPFVESLRGLSF